MAARVGVAGFIASIPAGFAVGGATAGWCPLVVGALVAFALGLIALTVLAPYVKGLNRLPWVGAAPLDVVFRLDGSLGLVTATSRDNHVSVLEVGVKNKTRWNNVTDAWINLLIPSGVREHPCDKNGRERDIGAWEEFTKHQLGAHPRADYWHTVEQTFYADLSTVLRFKIRFPEPGEYPVLFKMGAASHYGIEEPATITVLSVAEDENDIRDQFSRLIVEAEQLLNDADEWSESQLRKDVFAWMFNASQVTSAAGLDPLPKRDPSTYAGKEHLIEILSRDLAGIYVLRDEYGREQG